MHVFGLINELSLGEQLIISQEQELFQEVLESGKELFNNYKKHTPHLLLSFYFNNLLCVCLFAPFGCTCLIERLPLVAGCVCAFEGRGTLALHLSLCSCALSPPGWA